MARQVGRNRQRLERRVFLALVDDEQPEVDGPRTIGFAAKRNISATDQSYGWPGYPQSSARFVSALNELEVLGVQPRAQISVIPFAATTYDQANEETDVKVLSLIHI